MSVKLTPARLRQIVMEESAAIRGETKKFRLTESQIRQLVRQELNEVFRGSEGNNPFVDDYEEESKFPDCDFVISTRTGLVTVIENGLGGPRENSNLLDEILEALGDEIGTDVSREELQTALETTPKELKKLMNIRSSLRSICPGARFEGDPL